MSSLFNSPTDRMTTYYTIHCYDQNSHYHADEDLVDNHILYKTFDRACDAIEERIRYYESEFPSPNREEKAKFLSKRQYVHYYETDFLFVISKMTVEEEKPKKYTYRYFVEKETRGTVVELRGSLLYSSLDDMLDILESEVVKFHLDMRARNWVPYSRQTIQEYMERNKRMTYDRVDDDDEGTITYAIHKYET